MEAYHLLLILTFIPDFEAILCDNPTNTEARKHAS
jgi:hypothetical protein